MGSASRRALVVGAGVNGLSTARALLHRGWDVEVLEAGPLPNPHAASYDYHRLIRPHYADHPGYARRFGEALAAWEGVWRDLGATHYVPRGMVALSRSPGDWSERAGESLAAHGIAHAVLPAEELAARFPHLETGGVRSALWTEQGGALLADRILHGLAEWLAARGVRLHANTAVTGVDAASGRVETARGSFSADVVVLAAGIGLPGLSPVPVPGAEPRRCTVVYADIPDDLAPLWENAPCWIDLGGGDDLWGMPPMLGLPAKFGCGLDTRAGDPARERETSDADTDRILAHYVGRMKGAERFIPRSTVANFYLMAEEERFVLRREGRVLSLTADSGHGFKFGALTGEDVARAIDEDRLEETATLLAAL
ncbi:FAD-binding oxidoreductase [Oceanicella sp. SM1341]|uniref:NAD(P)/FAD-dependent oxidoreductase n=1 Tax=Oceanicella sp. SM1341 TaxID=1548889 RepID=UPI000E4AB19D|nr:FAD-dependent oxidoreductase [Oceanicella sp. SM1341]